VRPGHSSPGAQGAHAPGVPAVPPPQPAQAVLTASAAASLPLGSSAAAAGRSGQAHARGTHCAREFAPRGDEGCVPAGQVNAPARHCVAADAAFDAVVVPAGHATQVVLDTAPTAALHVPSGHSEKEAAPPPLNVPAGASVQAAAPAPAYAPAAQGAHCDWALAPGAALAVPAGQERHAANVCPATGLYVPGGHGEQLDTEVPPGRLLKEPGAHASHATAPPAAA